MHERSRSNDRKLSASMSSGNVAKFADIRFPASGHRRNYKYVPQDSAGDIGDRSSRSIKAESRPRSGLGVVRSFGP